MFNIVIIIIILLLLMWLQTACLSRVQKLIFLYQGAISEEEKMLIWVIVVALSNVVV